MEKPSETKLNFCDKLFVYYMNGQINNSVRAIDVSIHLFVDNKIIFKRLKKLEKYNLVVRVEGKHRRDISYKVVD
jgi:DNA-binding MarR family transcriptional regulator